MKIRSVTVNSDLSVHERESISSLLEDARRSMPFEVETVRASTVPQNGQYEGKESAISSAIEMEEWAECSKIDYIGGFGLGRYPSSEDLKFLKWLPDIFDRTE
ncbi:MAG: hypothetical protein JW825_01460, partial [Candidatus Methanofastidiosa archaeon]|nr:hypothetical protein [Candidatus Methanofastidiosa archaeon]